MVPIQENVTASISITTFFFFNLINKTRINNSLAAEENHMKACCLDMHYVAIFLVTRNDPQHVINVLSMLFID